MQAKVIIGSVLISSHEKLMLGSPNDLPFFLWKTAVSKWHASDVIVFIAPLEKFAAIIDCLSTLASGELLIA